jgi:NitT/TauT family transport system substrate-binding protein
MPKNTLPRLSLAVLALAAVSGPVLAQDVIRVGFGTTWPTFSHLQWANELGLLDGRKVEITVLEDVPRGYQMLAAGQLDVLFAVADYTPIAASQDLPFKLVSLVDISNGADQIVLAPGVTAADLKGQKVGASEGFVGELFMSEYLHRNGIGAGDVTWVNISPDQIVGPMLSGDIKAGYTYEPWTSELEKALPGTTRALTSADPDLLAQGILADSLYMSDAFLADRPADVDAILRGYFQAVSRRMSDPAAGNTAIAAATGWPSSDIEAIIGANGKSADGGMYVIDFDEAARQCSALEGTGPLGQANGAIFTAVATLEEGWIRRGTLVAKDPDLQAMVDCGPLKRLAEGGFRTAAPAN